MPNSSDLRRSQLVHPRSHVPYLLRAGRWGVLALQILSWSPRVGHTEFVDATSGALVGQFADKAAWVDFDGDGDLDLALLTLNGTRLFGYDRGRWVDAGALGSCCASLSQAWGDYDNDGDPDLYQVHGMYGDSREASRLVRNLGGGSFQDVPSVILQQAGAGQSAAWVDFDNDGDLDLSVFNDASISNRLYRNEGEDVFVNATPGVLRSASSLSGAWGDYDNDGDLDLYLVNTTAPNQLLRNDGAGTFVDVTNGPLGGSFPPEHRHATWGDYDNDGDLDLALAVGGEQPGSRLYRNDRDGTFVDVTTSPLADANQSQGAAWSDYDNDGDLDLFLAALPGMGSTIGSKLFRNDGHGLFVEVADAAINATFATGFSCGDFDADNETDYFIRMWNQASVLLRNDLAISYHWLSLDLVGTLSNRAAIGARIEVTAAGVTQIRENADSDGHSLTVEFGLGAVTVADAIVVRWPFRTRAVADRCDRQPAPDDHGAHWNRLSAASIAHVRIPRQCAESFQPVDNPRV